MAFDHNNSGGGMQFKKSWNSPNRGGGGGGGFRGRGGGGGGFRGRGGGGGGFRGRGDGGGGGFRGRGGGGGFRGRGDGGGGGGFRGRGGPGGGRGRSFGGGGDRGGGFRGRGGGKFGGGDDKFNRKRKFNDDDSDDDDSGAKKVRFDNKKANFFKKPDESTFAEDSDDSPSEQTPQKGKGILKTPLSGQTEKKNVKLNTGKSPLVKPKTPSTPHPVKNVRGFGDTPSFNKKKVEESSDEDEEDADISDEEAEDFSDEEEEESGDENVDEAVKAKLRQNGFAQNPEIETGSDEEESSDDDGDESPVKKVPVKAQKGNEKNGGVNLELLSIENSKKVEIMKLSLFVPSSPSLKDADSVSKLHPFISTVWNLPGKGFLIFFDSSFAREYALRQIKSGAVNVLKNAHVVKGEENKTLMDDNIKIADAKKLLVDHLPQQCNQSHLKLIFPNSTNIQLKNKQAIVSFNDVATAKKSLSVLQSIRVFGKPVLVKFLRQDNAEVKTKDVIKPAVKNPKEAVKVVGKKEVAKKVVESSDDDEDEELEDEEGLIDDLAEDSDIPSSEEGIEELDDSLEDE